MRVVLFGSPGFALPTLEALAASGHELALVVSQPARPAGRHGRPADPPVVARARELGPPVSPPAPPGGEAPREGPSAAGADLFVVVAYGRILGPLTLALPRLMAVNVHGSLLPRWRGASPVQAALLAGDRESGVSIMKMDEGMDTGAVLAAEGTPVGADEDAASLSARLAALGASLLVATLPRIEDGTAVAVPQPEEGVTLCPKIRREAGRVEWGREAEALVRRDRAFRAWPGLFAFRHGQRVKLSGLSPVGSSGAPGTVLQASGAIVVACGDGAVSVSALQAEGRRELPAAEFVRGERVVAGEVWT